MAPFFPGWDFSFSRTSILASTSAALCICCEENAGAPFDRNAEHTEILWGRVVEFNQLLEVRGIRIARNGDVAAPSAFQRNNGGDRGSLHSWNRIEFKNQLVTKLLAGFQRRISRIRQHDKPCSNAVRVYADICPLQPGEAAKEKSCHNQECNETLVQNHQAIAEQTGKREAFITVCEVDFSSSPSSSLRVWNAGANPNAIPTSTLRPKVNTSTGASTRTGLCPGNRQVLDNSIA